MPRRVMVIAMLRRPFGLKDRPTDRRKVKKVSRPNCFPPPYFFDICPRCNRRSPLAAFWTLEEERRWKNQHILAKEEEDD